MTKQSGKLGYSIEQDKGHGVIEESPYEVKVAGNLLRDNPRMGYGDSINGTLSMSMSFSFIADKFAIKNATKIRYLILNGEAWTVNTIQIVHPRITVELGGAYNGPTA